jgi:hypothetical protein
MVKNYGGKMRNPEIERLEAKLKLWDTPGFSQFIEDLNEYKSDIFATKLIVESLKRIYQHNLNKLKDDETKFKQGKLEL